MELSGEQAIDICEEHDISLVMAEEPEVLGEWNWLHNNYASEGFSTKGDCAMDACKVLLLYDVWE